MKEAFEQAMLDKRSASIDDVVEAYVPIVEEFLAFNERTFARAEPYRDAVYETVNELARVYDFRVGMMFVKPETYTPEDWGPLFWRFVHLTAILVTHAYQTDRIGDMLRFPTIVYNIDVILICSICANHYAAIKNTPEIRNCLKEMSFGYAMTGAQNFHNIVTQNVYRTSPVPVRPKPRFGQIDHAEVYGCIELPEKRDQASRTRTYARNVVSWQPPKHRRLAILVSLGSRPLRSYVDASLLLERAYADPEDTKTRSEIDACLERATTFRVEEAAVRANARVYETALRSFHEEHGDATRRLLDRLRERHADDEWFKRSVEAIDAAQA